MTPNLPIPLLAKSSFAAEMRSSCPNQMTDLLLFCPSRTENEQLGIARRKYAKPLNQSFGTQSSLESRSVSAAHQDVERRLLDFLPSRLAATVYRRHDRGPMRPVGRRRGLRPGGLYYSQKMGRMVGYESDNEKFDFYRSEVGPEVVCYREQPHTIEGTIGGKVRRYTPDREDRFADGHIEIVEVKDQFEAEKEPDYHAKLTYFAEVYERLGWSFRLTTRDEIKDPVTFETIETVQRYRRSSFTAGEIADVRRKVSQHGECRLAELLPIFSSEVVGLSKLCAMMVGRILVLDIRSKLEPSSIVKLS